MMSDGLSSWHLLTSPLTRDFLRYVAAPLHRICVAYCLFWCISFSFSRNATRRESKWSSEVNNKTGSIKRESTGGVDAHGVSRSSSIQASEDMHLAVDVDPRCSRRDICTAMSAARRLHQMDGSAVWLIAWRTSDHHTRVVRLRAVVEKDKSFNTQRMLAHGIQTSQTALYKLVQHTGMDALAFSSCRGHTSTTHGSYDFAYSTQTQSFIRGCNKPGSLSTFKTRFYVIVLSTLDPHVAELRTKHVCVQARINLFPKLSRRMYDTIMQKCRRLCMYTTRPPPFATELHKLHQPTVLHSDEVESSIREAIAERHRYRTDRWTRGYVPPHDAPPSIAAPAAAVLGSTHPIRLNAAFRPTPPQLQPANSPLQWSYARSMTYSGDSVMWKSLTRTRRSGTIMVGDAGFDLRKKEGGNRTVWCCSPRVPHEDARLIAAAMAHS